MDDSDRWQIDAMVEHVRRFPGLKRVALQQALQTLPDAERSLTNTAFKWKLYIAELRGDIVCKDRRWYPS